MVCNRGRFAETAALQCTPVSFVGRKEPMQAFCPAPGIPYDAVLGSIGCQMLVLRVSGIRKTAITKHTAGTTIG
jgi:hypothetical protein